MSEWDSDSFEEAKRASFLQVLFRVARLANERSIARLRDQTGLPVREAHTRVFPHVPFDGIRLTELAERLGVTKQATQQLVDELEEMGMLERVPDPSDGRAKLIQWSEEGRRGLASGVDMLRALESEYAEAVGADRLETAHQVLIDILDMLE